MPKTSKDSAPERRESGPAIDRFAHLDDYTVNFTTILENSSLAPLLKGLPDDACQCPHWGYVLTGEMTVTYTDGREETYAAGDAFYMPRGTRRVPSPAPTSSCTAPRSSWRSPMRPSPRTSRR